MKLLFRRTFRVSLVIVRSKAVIAKRQSQEQYLEETNSPSLRKEQRS
jgi:hypothetical protein